MQDDVSTALPPETSAQIDHIPGHCQDMCRPDLALLQPLAARAKTATLLIRKPLLTFRDALAARIGAENEVIFPQYEPAS